jgi:hypothetical protein
MVMAKYFVSAPPCPIWDDADGKLKSTIATATHSGEFNRKCRTPVWNELSTADVASDSQPNGISGYTMDVITGPILNDDDAKVKCPVVCASYGGEWNGQWKTVVEGKMSICGCKFRF